MNPLLNHFLSLLASLAIVQGAYGGEEISVRKETASGAVPSKSASKSMYPFRGTVASIDLKAGTVGLARQEGGARILHIGAESNLSRDGSDITLESLKTGDYLKGRVERLSNGEEVIVKATAGTKPEKSEDDSRSKRSRKETSN